MTEPLIDIRTVCKKFDAESDYAVWNVSSKILPGEVTGLVGPDGSGKTTMLRLMAGLLRPSQGSITVAGHDTREGRIAGYGDFAYMPQHFGLYEDLSVLENLRLHADLRMVSPVDRSARFDALLEFTGLRPFTARLAGKLSGGMKQKLGLACALVKTPKLLLLDEPSVGVDPISRRELWLMIMNLAEQGMGVVWSTAYLDEAERCAKVLLLNGGQLLYQGPPSDLTDKIRGRAYVVRNMKTDRRVVLAKLAARDSVLDAAVEGQEVRFLMAEGDEAVPTVKQIDAGDNAAIIDAAPRFEDAFIDLLGGIDYSKSAFADMPERPQLGGNVVIKSVALTRRFGDFVAANNVNFEVKRGQVFGLIGPNGAGKSTTFKMLCGLLKPSSGSALVAGLDLGKAPSKVRARIGYMAQGFSLYRDLSVRQNLDFFAGIYGLTGRAATRAIARVVDIFYLKDHLQSRSGELSLGFKRRLALACAVMHEPDILFLDEPTSGVDPKTRREFWGHFNAMVTRGVTVIVTTHFLGEAEYCDQISLIDRGKIIATGSPEELRALAQSSTLPNPSLEEAFIALVTRQQEHVA